MNYFFLLLCILACSAAKASCSLSATVLNRNFSSATDNGYIYLPFTLAENSLKSGAAFNVFFTFTTESQQRGGLGFGWEFPLLDARAIKSSDSEWLVYSPNSYLIKLKSDASPHPKGTLKYRDESGRWRAQATEEGGLQLTSSCGTQYQYKHGKPIRATEGKNTVEWRYNSEGLPIEVLLNGTWILRASWKATHISEVTLPGGRRFDFSYQQNVPEDAPVFGPSKINGPGLENIEIQRTTQGISLNEKTFSWGANGLIKSDPDFVYEILEQAKGGCTAKIRRIKKKNEAGYSDFWWKILSVEEFWHDADTRSTRLKTGYVDQVLRRHTSGLLLGMQREIEHNCIDGVTRWTRFIYDEHGTCIKQTDMFGRTPDEVYDTKKWSKDTQNSIDSFRAIFFRQLNEAARSGDLNSYVKELDQIRLFYGAYHRAPIDGSDAAKIVVATAENFMDLAMRKQAESAAKKMMNYISSGLNEHALKMNKLQSEKTKKSDISLNQPSS